MNRNRDYITKQDLRYELDRLKHSLDTELKHYAKKKDLSELKAQFFKATIWLMVAAASIATSAVVITEHFTNN